MQNYENFPAFLLIFGQYLVKMLIILLICKKKMTTSAKGSLKN